MSPEHFLEVADLFSEAAVLLTREGVVLAANREVARLGLNPKRLAGRLLEEFSSTPAETVRDYLRLCSRSGEPVIGSMVLLSDEAKEIDCRCDGRLIQYGPSGSDARLLLKFTPKERAPTQFVFLNQKLNELTQEIHRRRFLERELWDQREWLEVTLASIGDGVIVTDEKGRVSFLNPVAEQLTGWRRHEAEGRPLEEVFQIVNEQTRQAAENPALRALREGQIVGLANHTVLISKDGAQRAIDDSAAPIRDPDGTLRGVVLVFRDVTERRRFEIERSRLAALVDSSDDAVVAMTFAGVVTDWNAGAERLFDYSAEEIVGQSVFSTIVPADCKEDLLQVWEQVQQGRSIDHFETVRTRKDGRRIPVSIRVSPIRDADGKIIGLSGIDRDISQWQVAERRRNVRLAATQILSQEQSPERALPGVLQTVCEALEWDVGCFWSVDPETSQLRCRSLWRKPSREFAEFEEATYRCRFGPGTSLPGRAWQNKQCAWIADVLHDLGFVRQAEAGKAGLHSAFVCPIAVGDLFLGVVEFFSSAIHEPDEDLLETMSTICGQIGQFLERKRAEDQHRQSEQELTDFFENAAIGLHWVGPDGVILRANQIELKMLGYTLEEYVGRHVAEFHVDQHVIEDMLQRLHAGEELRDYEVRMRAKDGSVRHVVVHSNVLRRNGEFIHSRCFTRDITERKKAEETLRESEEHIRSVVDHALDGIVTIDDRGAIQTFNPAAERLFGYSAADAVGRNVNFLMPEPYHSEHDEYLAHYLKTGEARIIGIGREVVGQRRDGSVFPMELAVSEFHVNDQRFFTGIVHDITERKRTEATLRFLADASKSLAILVDYRSTLQKVAHLAVPNFADWCAVDVVDDDGSVQRLAVAHVDPSKAELAERLSQLYPPTPDSPHGVMRVLHTGEAEMMTEIPDALLEQAAHDEEHLRILRELDLKSYICVPLAAHGRTFGVLTFVSAESGRLYGPHDLAVAEDLTHRATIAIENARLYQEVREADRRKDEFLAMLAHELRNPLAPIRSGLDILAMEADGRLETIELMQQQVEHLVRLVDDLLDVSRIVRGRIELRRESVALSTVLRRSVEAVRASVEEQEQELVLSIPDEEIWLNADPVRLVQVVENLLNNASKYTDCGGRIRLAAELRDGDVRISVEDTGVGVEPDLLPKVFDLFTQSSRSLDRAQGGLGIGLTLVRNLVEMHGGTVSAQSAGAGKGSKFTVRIPFHEAVPATKAAPLPRPVATRRRVLAVDDNVGAARMLALLLEKLGSHEVATAYDGPQALEKIRELHPEVVLLDIGLPGMDGYEVGRAIREDPQFDDVLLVALTGYGQEEDRRKSREAGFDEHLVKPPALGAIERILAHPKLVNGPRFVGRRQPTSARPSAALSRNKPLPTGAEPTLRGPATPSPARPTIDPQTARFLRDLVHEIGNVLFPFRIMLQMLQSPQIDQSTLETTRNMLAEHLPATTALVDNLRQMTRTLRGCGAPKLDRVQVGPLVRQIVAAARPLLEERTHQLEVSLTETPLQLEADPQLLEQAVLELLKNAARYTGVGGRISLVVGPQNGELVVRVRDTGAGISPELLPRVFDPFVRGDELFDFAAGHFGVGLSLVRQIVECHGGAVEAHSGGPGQGSEFVLRLPLSPPG